MTGGVTPPIFLSSCRKKDSLVHPRWYLREAPLDAGANAINLCTALWLGIAIAGIKNSSGAKLMAGFWTQKKNGGECADCFHPRLTASGDPGSALWVPRFCEELQRRLPLVAFLWSARTVLSRTGKIGLDLRRLSSVNMQSSWEGNHTRYGKGERRFSSLPFFISH